ncbi:hypothetical protein [Curvivirga aplysinae]|uniref:hypothetical protein n=1 Tax=Curvivirga aplysinae TaxID=2529852 RepID=UPI0012BC355E|nr:hypothetical protein [Curvivirga aplysinae]MTI11238.1 hypothetical protein [Curvivirga aplysinae]
MAGAPKVKGKDMGPIMFLSLFLLLLAFFILLNTLSTFEEAKARKVIKSVTSTFKTELINETKAQIMISTVGPVPEANRVINDVEKLWVTAVPIAEVETLRDGSVMQMTVPTREIFVVGEIALRADRLDLIRDTAAILEKPFEGNVLELQFMLGVDSLERLKTTLPKIVGTEVDETVNPEEINLDEPDEDNRSLAFARTGVVAQQLITEGAPKSGISIGLMHGDPKVARMRFYVHPESSAFNTFTDEVIDQTSAPLIPNPSNVQSPVIGGSAQ